MTTPLPAKALLIGIADYRHVNSLPIAVRNDVHDIANLLQNRDVCGYAPGSIEVLTDGDATTKTIVRMLTDAARTLTEDDSFLVYFSGHGHRMTGAAGEESYLVTHESEFGALATTALRDSDLLELLRAIPSRRQVILIDACHAGSVGTLKSPGSATPNGFAAKGIERLANGRGRVVLASSRDDEVSVILPGARNSLFTDSVLRALKGEAADRGDGLIGVLDLFNYVARDVPKHADQHPIFKADGLEENIAIAQRPSQSRSKNAATSSAVPIGDVVQLMSTLYPMGPTQAEIWSRGGGDVSRLLLAGHGQAQWHAAIKYLFNGGGGMNLNDLLETAAGDFPGSAVLQRLLSSAKGARHFTR